MKNISGTLITTAALLKSILCFIDAENTPKIAYDNDELAVPLANKLKSAIGNKDGSQWISLTFFENETELSRQFIGVCENIKLIYLNILK